MALGQGWAMVVVAAAALVALAPLAAAEVSLRCGGSDSTEYDSLEAMFGPSLPKRGLVGVLLNALPSHACSKVSPPTTNHSGLQYIALIERGEADNHHSRRDECSFAEKVKYAQDAGYGGVIIFDDEHEGLIHMDTDNDTLADEVKIPAVFVTEEAGIYMRSCIGSGLTLVTLFPDPMPQWPSFLVTFIVIIACFLFMFTIFMFYRQRTRFQASRVERLSTAEVMKLPTRVQGPIDPEEEVETCCICLAEYEEGDVQIVLPCNHVFHKACVEPWLLRRRRTCPMCKRDPLATESAANERTPLVASSASVN